MNRRERTVLSLVLAFCFIAGMSALIAEFTNAKLEVVPESKPLGIDLDETFQNCGLVDQLRFDLNNKIKTSQYCTDNSDCMLLPWSETTAINRDHLKQVKERQLLINTNKGHCEGPVQKPRRPMATPVAICQENSCIAVDWGAPDQQ